MTQTNSENAEGTPKPIAKESHTRKGKTKSSPSGPEDDSNDQPRCDDESGQDDSGVDVRVPEYGSQREMNTAANKQMLLDLMEKNREMYEKDGLILKDGTISFFPPSKKAAAKAARQAKAEATKAKRKTEG
ncbi:hypothetical protein MPER_14109, partial [Moniliophthora perniciosa FA553]